MVDQASVKDGKSNGSPEARVVGGVAEFGNDITTLIELQAKLAVIDFKEALARATIPMALVVVALALLLAALPVALLGVARLVAVALSIREGWAMLLTAGVVMLAATVTLIVSVRNIPPSFSSFQRSREELARNIAWIRTVLLYSGRHLPRRLR